MNDKEKIDVLLGNGTIPEPFIVKRKVNYIQEEYEEFSFSFISFTPLQAYIKCSEKRYKPEEKEEQPSYDFLYLITYLDVENDVFMVSMPTPPNGLLYHQKCFQYDYESCHPFTLEYLCRKAHIGCPTGIHKVMETMREKMKRILEE